MSRAGVLTRLVRVAKLLMMEACSNVKKAPDLGEVDDGGHRREVEVNRADQGNLSTMYRG